MRLQRTLLPSRWAAAYGILLVLQTAAASCLLWIMLPIFRRMISRIGEPLDVELWRLATVIGCVTIMQSCYWIRFHRVPVYIPFRNVVVGHLLLFASRASFFFGGAFFSVIFFRHVPELSALPPLGQGFAKALAVLAILFSLFCYSLELERLGKAMEGLPTDVR